MNAYRWRTISTSSRTKMQAALHFRIGSRISAFTLVELMVALALSLFLIGGVILTYSSGRAATLDAEALSRIQENTRFASDYLVRDIRNAGFRDQLSLKFDHFIEIGEKYAEIVGSQLTIRYTARAHCAETFNEFKAVENTYHVDNSGNLVCTGRALTGGSPGTVALAPGVEGVSFSFIGPGGVNPGNTCNFDDDSFLSDNDDQLCIGVNVHLTMAGLQGDQNDRAVTLTAAFRNVIVDRVYGR